uniref:Uncharacterized protein LOC108047698 n=1 Tax=Drosophila rhopaloa TaxID=1041015 RepID=A0A6P4FD91_DRORH
MFKSKSFDLVSEEKSKQPERLYQPRRMRWLKYIILPAVFSFALLLILVNVDFSDNATEVISNSTDLGNEHEWNYTKNKCRFKYETLILICNYEFKNNTLEKNFFCGRSVLQNFTIENSTINHIADATFDQNRTRSLLSLQLINVQLDSLTQSALQGLQKLQNFTLINGNSAFKPLGFLSAVSETVCNARIHQQYSTEIEYSISDFLGPRNFSQLKWLDLSGTNIGETLSEDSFDNLPALEELILKGSGLHQIEWDFLPSGLKLLPQPEIFSYTAETTINEEEHTTVQAIGAFAPQVVGTPTTSPTTVSNQSTTPLYTEETTIDESMNCDENSCQDLICTYLAPNSSTGSLEQESSTECGDGVLVEICESVCITPFYYCMILGDNFTSSINCCSNKTTRCVLSTEVSGCETNSDLVIGLGVGLFFVGILLGVAIVYLTLRWKPSWLSASERPEYNTVGLIPRKSEKDTYDNKGAPISTLDNNEYITAYHRYLEQANHLPTESNKYISPPRDRAPSVPPSSTYHLPLPLPLPERNNYIYESCEVYEELP